MLPLLSDAVRLAGIALNKWPAIEGIDVDLAAMFRVVAEFGGCQSIIDNGLVRLRLALCLVVVWYCSRCNERVSVANGWCSHPGATAQSPR